MEVSKEELIVWIEQARKKLDSSIENQEDYPHIYENSVALDRLIEAYLTMGHKK